jgi:hypothetical protein
VKWTKGGGGESLGSGWESVYRAETGDVSLRCVGNVDVKDAGLIQVTATNPTGTATSSANLLVKSKSVFKAFLQFLKTVFNRGFFVILTKL